MIVADVFSPAAIKKMDLEPADQVNVFKGPVKVKVKQDFIMLFVENFQRLVPLLTKNELKVMLSILKFMGYSNVFSVTQKAISNDSGVPVANVSRAMAVLKKLMILSVSVDGVWYINPFIFSKGKLLEVKKNIPILAMVFGGNLETGEIKNPF